MTRLLLVRHAAPAGTWGEDDDPGLTELGHRQAAELVADPGERWPGALLSSPLRRARETAAPLARRLGATVRVEPRVGMKAIKELRRRGHEVEIAADWSEGYIGAAGRNLDNGLLEAGCDPRGTKGEVFPACALSW